MTKFPDILGRRRLEKMVSGKNEAEARAYRMTSNVQLVMMALPTLLMPNVLLVEPPETHALSLAFYVQIMVGLVIGRLLLFKQRLLTSTSLTIMSVLVHMTGLCIAYPDDPAYLGFLLLAILPFLMFPPERRLARWLHVALPAIGFLAYQYYYRVLGGSGVFGAPKWIVSADYIMPPLVLVIGFFILIINQFVKAVDNAEAKLLREYEKSDALLLNILPAPIAQRLKENSETIADGFDQTTILFSDIVGFTELSQTVSPAHLVKLLNALFSRFDDLADQHGLEKIKTIGDAYMVAAGLPTHRADHAAAIANMALAMRATTDEFTGKIGKPLRIRIGIHSGSVVAGVIGKRKFIYDVWGDSVNTAARMESHGIPGEIQVSETTYNLLHNDFNFEPRGPIEIKGKGPMPTWLLKGQRS